MAIDPGTALAIISLGITVCDGIINYCSAFKRRKEDVQSLTDISTELQTILQEVQAWLRNRPTLSNSMANRVDGCVGACLAQIDEILGMCAKHSSPPTNDLKSRLLYVKRGLQFPITKETMRDLISRLISLRANVQLGLTLLASDFSFEGFEALRKMIQQSEQRTTQSTIAHINQAEQEISKHIKRSESLVISNVQQLKKLLSTQMHQDTCAVSSSLTTNIDLHFTDLEQSTSTRIQQIETTVAQKVDSLSQDLDVGQQSIIEELREIKRLIQTECNSQSPQQAADLVTRSSNKLLRPRPRHPHKTSIVPSQIHEMCTCNAKITKKFFFPKSRKWFQVTSDVCLIHDRQCPVWYTSQRKVTTLISFRLFRLFISGSIEFSDEYYGWRGWSAAPSLNLQCSWTVPSNSGAFALLSALHKTLSEYKPCSIRDWNLRKESALAECLTALHDAFTSGEASPHDVDEDGNNILHILARRSVYPSVLGSLELGESIRFVQKVQSLWMIDLHAFNEGNTWIDRGPRTPIELLLHDTAHFGCAVDDLFERGSTFHYLLDWLIKSGFDVGESFGPGESHSGYPWKDILRTPMAQYPSVLFPLSGPEFMEAAQCNPLSTIVLKRDDYRLRIELRSHPTSLGEVNLFGQNAFHLATEWTDGLRILLQSGCITGGIVNQLDDNQRSALDYAALQGNSESVEILLDAGSCFDLRLLDVIVPNCRRLFISALYERRRQLRDLAIGQKNSKKNNHMESFGLFTSDSASIMHIRSLEEARIAIPESLRSSVLSKGTLYHPDSIDYLERRLFYHNKHMLQDLMAAGFIHVDESWNGLTPLMTLSRNSSTIQIAELFLENGADPDKEIPLSRIQNLQSYDDDRRHRAVHKLAFEIGKNISSNFKPVKVALQLAAARCLQKAIFQNTSNDPCFCGCSPGGCSAFTCLLKGYWNRDSSNYARSIVLLDPVYQELDLDNQNGSIIPRELIRMITFESLQLTHTCCSFGEASCIDVTKPMAKVKERVEIYRIQEEERADLQLLEKLMGEFNTKFTELGIRLDEFIEGYWGERMEEELYKTDQIPEDELMGQREHLVYLREEKNMEDDFFEQLWEIRSEDFDWTTSEEEYDEEEDSEAIAIRGRRNLFMPNGFWQWRRNNFF